MLDIIKARHDLEYYTKKANESGYSGDDIEYVKRGVMQCVMEGQLHSLSHVGGYPFFKILWAQHNLMRIVKEVDGFIELED